MRLPNRLLILLLLCLWGRVVSGQSNAERPSVGLVLSGGAAKGIAHIGALKVIEEAGLPVDYIAGTSMGSIVGGLYAIGYDADSLEHLALTLDWNRLITDEIPRRELSIEEKYDADRFYVSFPIQERRLQLPTGVIPGQNVENILNWLCMHVYDVRDFNALPIPFQCVAADIATGEEVAFSEGYLPEVIRASMAIPTIFDPVEIKGRLLVDGGLIDNFPADNVSDMGADIIIGVDVGKSYYEADEITDLFKIVEQAVFMYGKENNERNRELCDILIDPDLEGYGLQSFNAADSLITRGYRAAKKFLPQLRALADSLRGFESIAGAGSANRRETISTAPSFEPLDSITVREIEIKGLKNVSEKLLTGNLRIEPHTKLSPRGIYNAFEQAYTSLYFSKIGYELEPVDAAEPGNNARLLVNVNEKAGGLIRVGLNYNNEYKATISLNATFRNVLLNGSKLSFNASLGENPVLLASYFKNNGWRPGFGLDVFTRNFGINIYQDGQKESIVDYTDFTAQLYTRSIISNSYSFGLGAEYEYIYLRPRVGSLVLPDDQTYRLYNLYGFIDFDTYDHLFYPTRGATFHSKYKLINNVSTKPIHFLSFKFEKAIRLSQRMVMLTGLSGGASSADSSFAGYFFYAGGLNNASRKGLMPFVGLDLTQKSARNLSIFRLDLQYNVWRQYYLMLRSNIGNATWLIEDQIFDPDLFYGAGLTLAYNSIIGPVEVTFMSSNLQDNILFYLHLGYWF